MQRLFDMLNKVMLLDERVILNQLLQSDEVKAWIIKMNQDQLFIDGINSLGVSLIEADKIGGYYQFNFYKGYSPYTKELKKQKGLPTGHVTLFEEGDFYASMKVEVNDGFEITADPMKDGESLFDRWGKEVLGLTDENVEKLKEYIKNELVSKIYQKIAA